jgi:LCP family protein required for cell wall assembly
MASGLETDAPRAPSRLWLIGIVAVLALSGAAACAVFNAVRNTVREFQVFDDVPPAPPVVTGTPDAIHLPEWTGIERVNILLLGIDEREVEEGPWRTDTLILLSLDPATQTAGMLSVPRDLWVSIPGYDLESKINTAHFIGDAQSYPGGGPALAMATVQHNLGIPVQYYVRLNFSAFERIIDLIGGVDICVDQPIDDPQYPDSGFGYEPLHIDAGCQGMDGRLALKYARTRHTEFGDFDRARRQQQVILAVRDKVRQAGLLPTLVGQAGPLFETLGDSVRTNFTLDQLIRLANLASQIDLDRVQSLVIDPSMTLSYLAPTDPPQYVLIPIREELRKLRDRLLSAGASAGLPAEADDATRLKAEAAVIRVENGTQSVGLAARTREFLVSLGFAVTSFGDAYDGLGDHASTTIIDHGNKPFTAAQLAEALNLPPTAVRAASPEGDGVDVRVVLGNDFASALGAQLLLTPAPTPRPTP